MRTLNRNKQTIFYALYEGNEESYDEYGNVTGEPVIKYSDPIEFKANVSPARGQSDVEQFGINANYTKTIVTDKMDCPIDEHSILWINIPTSEPFNYVVTSVARSINSITFAVKEVETSGQTYN